MPVTLVSCYPTFIKAAFNGRSGSGAISVPGLQVGDIVLVFVNGNWASSFESPTVSVADEMQQTSGADLSSISFELILIRWA